MDRERSQADNQEKHILGRENSKCKYPLVEVCFARVIKVMVPDK